MSVAHGLLLTQRGIKRMQRERADLRDWLGRLTLRAGKRIADHRRNKEIELILFEGRVVKDRLKRVDAVLDHALTLPSVWSHKTEARAGDTVYLRHNDSVRALTLAPAWNADPANGRVSVVSPLGLRLIGRHQGDRVRLDTLDGRFEYRILKIV